MAYVNNEFVESRTRARVPAPLRRGYRVAQPDVSSQDIVHLELQRWLTSFTVDHPRFLSQPWLLPNRNSRFPFLPSLAGGRSNLGLPHFFTGGMNLSMTVRTQSDQVEF